MLCAFLRDDAIFLQPHVVCTLFLSRCCVEKKRIPFYYVEENQPLCCASMMLSKSKKKKKKKKKKKSPSLRAVSLSAASHVKSIIK